MRGKKYIHKPGERYGKLTVIEDVGCNGEDRGHKVLCKCDCGNEIIISSRALLQGNTKGCGKCRQNEYVGKRFGKLVIIEKGFYKKYKLYFKCKCDCGNEKIVALDHLLDGHTTSCNECTKYDVIGKRFGNLTVLEYAGTMDNSNQSLYKVKCDCGNIKIVDRQRLRNSHKYSYTNCGDCYFALPDSYKKDLHDRCVKLAHTWRAMNSRCTNPNNPAFYRYGGRGIKCEIDKMAFIRIYYKDPSFSLDSNVQIDRIDNNDSYKIGNMRWVSGLDNTKNTIRQEKLSYSKCASMLISLSLFKILTSVNNFNTEEFTKIRTNQKVQSSKGGTADDPLYLFIHKSLMIHKDFYINTIKKYYEDCGGIITFTEE